MASMPSPVSTEPRPPVPRAVRVYKVAASSAVVLVLAIWMLPDLTGTLRRGGLHPCARLDQRLCADLGAARCDVWTNRLHRSLAASSQPHQWRRNKTAVVDVIGHKLFGWDAAHEDNPL